LYEKGQVTNWIGKEISFLVPIKDLRPLDKIVHPLQRDHHAYICNDQGTIMCAYEITRNHHTCIKSFLLPRDQHVCTVHMSFIPLKELQTIVYATTCISWLLYWGLEGIWLYRILKKRMFVCSQSGIIHRKM